MKTLRDTWMGLSEAKRHILLMAVIDGNPIYDGGNRGRSVRSLAKDGWLEYHPTGVLTGYYTATDKARELVAARRKEFQ